MDAVVISGLLAVLLAEVVGELRERLQGGTEKKHMRFDHGEFTSAIGAEDIPSELLSEENQTEQEEHKVDDEKNKPSEDDYPGKEGN